MSSWRTKLRRPKAKGEKVDVNVIHSTPSAASSAPQETRIAGDLASQMPSLQEPSPISELWNHAYDGLRSESTNENLIDKYEAILQTTLATVAVPAGKSNTPVTMGRQDDMLRVLNQKLDEIKNSNWKLKLYNREIYAKDLMDPVVSIIDLANEYVSDALSANPYASIAWAGVGLILPVSSRTTMKYPSLKCPKLIILDLPQSL